MSRMMRGTYLESHSGPVTVERLQNNLLKADKWKPSTPEEEEMDFASNDGKISELENIKNSRSTLHYSTNAIDWASEKGRNDVLRWWKDSGLPLKYTERSMSWASDYGHVNTLQWWKDSGLELKYDEHCLDFASEKGHLDVLKWWLNSGLQLYFTTYGREVAAENEYHDVVQWWDHFVKTERKRIKDTGKASVSLYRVYTWSPPNRLAL